MVELIAEINLHWIEYAIDGVMILGAVVLIARAKARQRRKTLEQDPQDEQQSE